MLKRTAGIDDDAVVTEDLQKMVKQRRESVDLYRKGGREDLAAAEAEIAVSERFLPRQMSEDEARAAVEAIIAETGASSMKDMGRVMVLVKERHPSETEPLHKRIYTLSCAKKTAPCSWRDAERSSEREGGDADTPPLATGQAVSPNIVCPAGKMLLAWALRCK